MLTSKDLELLQNIFNPHFELMRKEIKDIKNEISFLATKEELQEIKEEMKLMGTKEDLKELQRDLNEVKTQIKLMATREDLYSVKDTLIEYMELENTYKEDKLYEYEQRIQNLEKNSLPN